MDIINVEKILWTEEYAIGNETIDTQHKGLFKTFNSLIEAIAENDGVKSKAQEILIMLVDYMQTHFKDEEEYMASIKVVGEVEKTKMQDGGTISQLKSNLSKAVELLKEAKCLQI